MAAPLRSAPPLAGYWLASQTGGVYAYGDAHFYGALSGAPARGVDVVGIAPTPDGKGYWLASQTGGVYAYGDAHFYGALSGAPARGVDVVGIAPTPDGKGYWLASQTGGVYAYGDAHFYGAPGAPARFASRRGRRGLPLVAKLAGLSVPLPSRLPSTVAPPTTTTTTTATIPSPMAATTTTTAQVGATEPEPAPPTGGSLGPDVYVFSPAIPQSTVQSDLDAIYTSQQSDQFGDQRYAVLFEPGTYGTNSDPLVVNVGYYEEIAGLGLSPDDVVIDGVVNSYNQCSGTTCNATDNFWRSVMNLTIDVNTAGVTGCYDNGTDFWAVSQGSPMRRVEVDGKLTLMDYCENPAYASGGFIADSELTGPVTNGSQQQYLVRNSDIDSWSNGVWDQVFCGDNGAPAQSFASNSGDSGGPAPYTTLATCGNTEEEPYLYTNSSGDYEVFVPSLENGAVGPSWASGNTPGTSLPLSTFYVVQPSSTVGQVNAALAAGDNLLFTPGVYDVPLTIYVDHPGTKVIGLGFPTLVATGDNLAMQVADVAGVNISGMIFDAGSTTPGSPALLQIGSPGSTADYSSDPVTVDDVFFRVGGAEVGNVTTAFIDDSNYSILDDVWSWRADHGAGAGQWGSDTGETGLEVNGNDVTAYGLAVEHYQQYETIWDGQGGTVVFFQNEDPYDVPDQGAWMATATQDGYPAFYVPSGVTTFEGYGMASYSYFDLGVDIEDAMAFEVPDVPGVQLHDVLTRFLAGSGGIASVVDGTGAAVSSSFGGPADVVTYP